MNTVSDMYYSVENIMEIMQYSKSKAYKVIKGLNDELEEQGYLTRPGLIPKRYFNSRYYGMEQGETQPPKRSRATKRATA